MTLDIASTAFLAQSAISGAPALHQVSVEEARLMYTAMAALSHEGPQMDRIEEVAITTADESTIRAHVLTPPGPSKSVIVYYHGGTWYWNRYPGARCDLESMAYSYSFSPELEQEWRWSEVYATQPEILNYVEHVAQRFDLNKDINFDTRVKRAVYDEDNQQWLIYTDTGEVVAARYFIMATGCLSVSKDLDIPGTDTLQGPCYVTGLWPHEGVDFTGQKVAVIGTGSSAIQSIPLIAEQATAMTIYQRTPAYSMPAKNRPLDEDEIAEIKANYPSYRDEQKLAAAAIVDPPRSLESWHMVDEEERAHRYDAAWNAGLLIAMQSTFNDI